MTVKVIRLSESDGRVELEGIYAEYPELRERVRDCCGGCAESELAHQHGWDHPILDAWRRAEVLRFLLGND